MDLKQIPHLVKKDLRDARWLIGAALLLVIVDLVLRLVDSMVISDTSSRAAVIDARGLLDPLSMLIVVLLIARIVHADPACGDSRAFWLSRPIAGSTLFVSKLTSVMLVLVAPGLLAIAVFLGAWRVPSADIALVAADALVNSLVHIVVLFTAAALTTRLPYMLLLLAGGLLTAIDVWFVSSMAVEALPLRAGQSEDDVRGFVLVPLVTLGSTLVVTTVAAWWTYRTRRYQPAAVLLFAFVIAMFAAPALVVAAFGHLIPGVPAVSEPWAASNRVAARIPLDQVHAATIALDETHGPGQSGPGVELEAPLLLDGLPDGYVASVWLRDVAWRVGTREVTEPFGFGFSDRRRGQWVSFSTTDQDWSVPVSFSPGMRGNWLVFLRLPAATYRRDRDEPGHYSATAVFTIYRYEPLGSQPLRAGSSIRVDSSERFDVVSTQDADDACTFDLRHTGFNRPFSPAQEASLGYRVEDASGRRLHPKQLRERRWHDDGPAAAILPSLQSMPLGLQQERLVVRAPPLSCAELRLAGVRVSQVGTLTRRIELPNLVLGSLEAPRP